jgi:basic membrane lipoprotein Med (substrate-binding protein (PBP1-ABC) superfamily)
MVDAVRASRITTVLLVAVVAVLAIACGRDRSATQPVFTVRMLTTRSLSGHWERAAERGLQRLGVELDAEIGWLRTDDPADDRQQLAEQGRARSKLVFCVGSFAETTLLSVAAAYPETVFVLLPGTVHAANVACVRFLPEEVGYLAGSVAGALSPDRRIELIRGGGQPWLELLEDGYVAGFKSRWRRAREVIGEGPDGVWKLSSAGVLVSLYAADQADPEVIAAAHNAGLQLVATDPRLLETEDVTVVAAIEVDAAEAMLRVAREVRDGTFEGRVFAFDLGSGVLDVAVNPGLAPDALTVANEALEEARAEITAGLVEFDGLGL